MLTSRNFDNAKLLLDAGVDLSKQITSLDINYFKNIRILKRLINNGINLNSIKTKFGTTLEMSLLQDLAVLKRTVDEYGNPIQPRMLAQTEQLLDLIEQHKNK